MLLPRNTDYYFKSYNVSNVASRVTNNLRNVNGPRYKKNCDRLTSPCSYCKSIQDNDAIINCISYNIDTCDKARSVKYTLDLNLGPPLYNPLPIARIVIL